MNRRFATASFYVAVTYVARSLHAIFHAWLEIQQTRGNSHRPCQLLKIFVSFLPDLVFRLPQLLTLPEELLFMLDPHPLNIVDSLVEFLL